MDAVQRPKVETQQFHVFTEEQACTFLAATKNHPFEVLFYLALTTSRRKGEVLGLMWSDVNWKKKTLRIERQLQQAGWRSAELVPPKTRSGRRLLKMGKATLAKLQEHR